MVKLLKDLCLQHIALNINLYRDLAEILTHQQKELLIKRMATHHLFTVDRIRSISNNLFGKGLKRLELHNTSLVNDGFLKKLSQSECLFEYISITNCKETTDKGLSAILTGQRNLYYLKLKTLPCVTGLCLSQLESLKLRKLVLKNLSNLKDQYVVQVVSNCPTISWVGLQYCRELTDACVMAVAAVLKGNLNILRISGISKITDQALESLVKNCTNLKELEVYGCNKLHEESINEILCELNLTSIDISYTCGYGSEIANLNTNCFSESLHKFISCGVQMVENVLVDLAVHCPLITSLELCGIDGVTDRSIRNITAAIGPHLREVDLSYCGNLTDEGIGFIMRRCTKLEALSLQFYTGVCEPLRMLAHPENKEQARCVKRLFLPGCRNFDVSILRAILPYLSNLKDFNMAAIRDFTDDLLFLVAWHCPLVSSINLKGCKLVTDAGVCVLVQYLKLVNVVLSGVNYLTDKPIFMMASSSVASSLEKLYVSGCHLISSHVLQYLKDVSVKGVVVQHRIPGVPSSQIMARNLDTGEFCRADLLL